MKTPRPITFYAWLGLGIQAALTLTVIVFVLAGASYQSAAVTALHQHAQRLQLANLILRAEFLDSQRALLGYQATGQDRFLQTYYTDTDHFALMLRTLRLTAWQAVLPGVTAQAQAAQASFWTGDQAVLARRGSARGARLYGLASNRSGVFIHRNDGLQQRLSSESGAFAAESEHTLGVGIGPVAAILAAGLMIPVLVVATSLRWTSRPLHNVTDMIRRRAHGDTQVRAVPGGPADVRDLAASANFLADETERLRATESARARLQLEARHAATRIRDHLHAADIIAEAVAALRTHLTADFVWAGLVKNEKLTLAEGDRATWDRVAEVAGYLPVESVPQLRELYQQQTSYCVQDLASAEAAEVPGEIREVLLALGGAALLVAPFGAGAELLGAVVLMRNDPRRGWTRYEVDAVESLAGDIGRALEHARLYEAEERLVAELQSLNQAKTSFLASASHDVRTPLTSILGYVELLADGEAGPLRPRQADMLDAVARNGRRLQTLIEDMLTISKIELGNFTSHLRPTDLASLLPDAGEVLRPSAADKEVSFEVSCEDQPLMIDGDPEQLDRVLINLLSNAVKYTPRGGTVTLTAKREADSALVAVSDTGIGIPQADQGSLFNRFFRASNAVALAIPGSGLGLSIVRTVVTNHHGDLNLVSKEGAGTSVTIRIPLLNGTARATERGQAETSARPGASVGQLLRAARLP